MAASILRIATRKSRLALWQAEHVQAQLEQAHPGLQVELVRMVTQGDQILDTPLAKVGGKGLFVKELEQGMLEGRADIAVHSIKDVPAELPPGLHLPVVLPREDPRDAFLSNNYAQFLDLPLGARLGTSSLRRQCQLRALRPDLIVENLRGNVETRLAKLDRGDFDAIVLAAAGLTRLGLAERITECLAPDLSLPAVGQGIIGIECRQEDERVHELIACLQDPSSQLRVTAERGMNARLEGGCQAPIAGYAELDGAELYLRGLVGEPSGAQVVRGERRARIDGDLAKAEAVGRDLAEELLSRGGSDILRSLYAEH